MPMPGEKVQMTRPGEANYVLQQLPEAAWRCCIGCSRMAVLQIRTHAQAQQEGATWQSCSGRDTMAAPGMRTPAPLPLLEATWQCYSGLARVAAAGMQ